MKITHEITPVAEKISFCFLVIFLIVFHIKSSSASEWYENGTLYEATFRQWKAASYNNKLATCADIILTTAQKGYLVTNSKDKLLNTNNTELL